MSLQVDRIKQNKIGWNSDYVNPNSQAYRVLEDESVYAVSCMNFTQSPRTLELPANLKQNFQKKNRSNFQQLMGETEFKVKFLSDSVRTACNLENVISVTNGFKVLI